MGRPPSPLRLAQGPSFRSPCAPQKQPSTTPGVGFLSARLARQRRAEERAGAGPQAQLPGADGGGEGGRGSSRRERDALGYEGSGRLLWLRLAS